MRIYKNENLKMKLNIYILKLLILVLFFIVNISCEKLKGTHWLRIGKRIYSDELRQVLEGKLIYI